MVNFGGRVAALALVLIFALTISGFLPSSFVSGEEPYSVTLQAQCGIEASAVPVPILLDGVESGFSTPHTFVGITGFHNFSLSNEHLPGHFIKQPPTVSDGLADAVLSMGVNWIVVGPPKSASGNASILFTYSSNPFVENFRDTFEPGTTAKIGVRVHMDPGRIASGRMDVYSHDWPVSSGEQPFFSANFAVQGGAVSYQQFLIPANATVGTWAYGIRIVDPALNILVNATFGVAPSLTPLNVNFTPPGSLPYSTLDIQGTRYALFENASASAVVLYIGGGIIGQISGSTPISGYSDITDEASGTYRLVYDLVAHGLSVVTPLGRWEGVEFPSQIVGYFRNQGIGRFYAIGHSAGGVVVAYSIVNYPYLFDKAIIADAPLTKESTGFYFTALSIRSENAKASHLLLWGRGDNQAELGNAYSWMDHANQTLATLKVFDYNHDWAGTAAEVPVREQIVNFLTEEAPPRSAPIERGTKEFSAAGRPSGALFDSELRAETKELLKFRDIILDTRFGSALTQSQPSWWRALTDLIDKLPQDASTGVATRLVLHPLNLMIRTGVWMYNLLPSELGAIAAVVLVSALFGASYLGLPLATVIRARRGKPIMKTLTQAASAGFFSTLVFLLVAEFLGLQSLIGGSVVMLVLTTVIFSALCSCRIFGDIKKIVESLV